MSQSFWASIYRIWIWLGVPVMAIAVAVLVLLILGLISLVNRAQLFSVPLAERQEVQFAEAGRVALSIEGPRFSTRFAHVDFELRSIHGERIEGSRTWLRSRSSGVSTARLELLKYDIPRPGRYTLIMTGLGAPQEKDARHAVVFTRPHLKQTVAYILGMLLAGGTFITSLVFFVLRLRETGTGD